MPVDHTYLPNPREPEVLREDWIDHPDLTPAQRERLRHVPDEILAEELGRAFRAYEDTFLWVLDSTRNDATAALLRRFRLFDTEEA